MLEKVNKVHTHNTTSTQHYWGFEVVAGCSQTYSEDWRSLHLLYVRCSSTVLILCFGHAYVVTGTLKRVQLCGCLYPLKKWAILRALRQLLRRLSHDGNYYVTKHVGDLLTYDVYILVHVVLGM